MAAAATAMATALGALKQRLREIEALESVSNLLCWDQQVFLPEGGQESRKAQSEALALVLHDKKTSNKLGECLDMLLGGRPLSSSSGLGFSSMEAATVREAARRYAREKRTPAELASRLKALEVTGCDAWVKAKQGNDFQTMAPSLQQWLDALKEEAAAVSPELHPYDFCLDKHERGASMTKLDALFTHLKQPLIDLVKRIAATGKSPDRSFLEGHSFSLESQRELSRRLAKDMGFSFEQGRLDESNHPMTISIASPGDVRLTSRYHNQDLLTGLLATMHEVGHGLYEQGRDLEASKQGLIASAPASLGLHESQSLIWERMVGLSPEFWEHFWPVLANAYPCISSSNSSSSSKLHRVVNEVKPSLIRVDADEVTYPLHVLVRYEIEKGLFDGSLSVQDIPDVWKQKMEEYVGVAPEANSEGCLQDIHWGLGSFGYFPTYVLGAVYAFQLFEAASKEMGGELPAKVAAGQLLPLREWLREKVHKVGSIYETADELITHVTGKPLDAAGYVRHLTAKYAAIYGLEEA